MLFFTIAPWLHLRKTTVRYASRCRQAVPESVAGVGTASMSLSHQCESAAGIRKETAAERNNSTRTTKHN